MIEDLKNILPIVQKFDQKFLTKRLTTAMEKVLKHCIVSLHADKIKIKIQGELRYVKHGLRLNFNDVQSLRIENRTFRTVKMRIKKFYRDS